MVQHSNTVLVQMAAALVHEKLYTDAADLYEQCAECCMAVKILRLSAFEYIFLCCLSHCASYTWGGGVDFDDRREADVERMEMALRKGEVMDPQWTPERREHEFVQGIVDAYRNEPFTSLKAFEGAVSLFVSVNRLDGVRLSLVEAIRSNFMRRESAVLGGAKSAGLFQSMFRKK